jgi:hypothetical protein
LNPSTKSERDDGVISQIMKNHRIFRFFHAPYKHQGDNYLSWKFDTFQLRVHEYSLNHIVYRRQGKFGRQQNSKGDIMLISQSWNDWLHKVLVNAMWWCYYFVFDRSKENTIHIQFDYLEDALDQPLVLTLDSR